MKISDSILNLLFPEGIVCIGCNAEMSVPSEYGLCGECSVYKNTRFCRICGRGLVGEGEYCNDCQKDKRYFDAARAPLIYEGLSRTLIHRFKIGNLKYLAKYLARFMYDAYSKEDWQPDLMTFVPIGARNLKSRGFNQSQLLALELSKLNGIKVKDLLKKVTDKEDFSKQGRKEREAGIKDSVEASEKLHKEDILLIDDVLTTGVTAEECAKVLKKAGANKVFVLTFATSECKPVLY